MSVSQFADDICAYCSFGSANRSRVLIQKAAEIMRQNIWNLGLDFAPHKCELVHFNNKKILPGETEIEINNHAIKSSSTVRFLGLIFDYKLSFVPHINMLKQKCNKRMNIIKFLCGVKWGSAPKTLNILYKSFVRSVIDYGSFICYPKTQHHIEALEKIQFAGLRIVMGYRISTPTNIILSESKAPSILERTKFLCKCYLAKIRLNSNISTFHSIQNATNYLNKNPSKNSIRLLLTSINDLSQFSIQPLKHYNIYNFDYKTVPLTLTLLQT